MRELSRSRAGVAVFLRAAASTRRRPAPRRARLADRPAHLALQKLTVTPGPLHVLGDVEARALRRLAARGDSAPAAACPSRRSAAPPRVSAARARPTRRPSVRTAWA